MGAEQGPEQPKQPLTDVQRLVREITLQDTVIYELKLQRAGLLEQLEQGGIVPIAAPPNPFNPELNEIEHEKWWENHPKEREEFTTTFERRLEVLKHLYIGMLLGHLLRSEPLQNDRA